MNPPGTPAPQPGTDPPTPASSADPDPEKTEMKRKLADFEKAETKRQADEAARVKAEKDKADKDLLDRGEHQKVIDKEKADRKAAEEKAEKLELRLALVVGLAGTPLAEGALDDVVEALSKQGLKVGADGKVEGLAEKIQELKKVKAFYFASGSEAPAAPETQPAARGLGGSNPARQAPTGSGSANDVVTQLNAANAKKHNPLQKRAAG